MPQLSSAIEKNKVCFPEADEQNIRHYHNFYSVMFMYLKPPMKQDELLRYNNEAVNVSSNLKMTSIPCHTLIS